MYSSLEKIIRRADEQNIPFWKAVQQHDCREEGRTEEESFQKMKEMYLAMKESDFEYHRIDAVRSTTASFLSITS